MSSLRLIHILVVLAAPAASFAQSTGRIDLECDVTITSTTQQGSTPPTSKTESGATTYSIDLGEKMVTDSKGLKFPAQVTEQLIRFTNATAKQPQMFTSNGVFNRINGGIEEVRVTSDAVQAAAKLRMEVKISGQCKQASRRF